jgi:hypothetical protein
MGAPGEPTATVIRACGNLLRIALSAQSREAQDHVAQLAEVNDEYVDRIKAHCQSLKLAVFRLKL